MNGDTIYAVASGRPPAAIAILRLSGPRAFAVAGALAGALPPSGSARLRTLCDPADGALLDRALVLPFRAPASATGEDVVELHLHGGRAVIAAVERAVAAQDGMRQAEPGEFTRRALMAGRIDLTVAEGLGDLLAAETEAQRRTALATAEGSVSRAVNGWAAHTVAIAAQLEAAIDFADDDDVAAEVNLVDRARAAAAVLAAEVRQVLATPPVERLHDGIRVVLAGPPNAGKSSIVNGLVQREAAIVTPISGTTRDRIEVPVIRNGIAYLLIDTAGLADDSTDPIETIGIGLAREAMASADIILWLGDEPAPSDERVIGVHSRSDLPGRSGTPAGRIATSAKTGRGMAALWAALERRANSLLPSVNQPMLNRRQRALCREAMTALADAAASDDALLLAEHLRIARVAFDRVTGMAGTEAMLDALFARFCVGK